MGGGAIGMGPILSLQSFSSAASSRRGCGALGLRRLLPSVDVTPKARTFRSAGRWQPAIPTTPPNLNPTPPPAQ